MRGGRLRALSPPQGPEAQQSFSQTWGVSYALDNCTEWQDVLIEACKVALILVILDLLRFTKDRPWFEARERRPGGCASPL